MADQLANHGGLSKAPPPQPAGGGGGKGDLLSQIRNPGFSLRKVDHDEVRATSVKQTESGLTSLLAGALEDMRKNGVGDSEDSGGNSDDSEEWSESD